MIPAPSFVLPDQHNQMRSLIDYTGRWLLVYFYPKDDTPGCTTEACNLRDEYTSLQALGLDIVGISKDSVRSHAKFAEKYHLNFPLLADVDHAVTEAYGAWEEKQFMGKAYMGISRKSFLIDPRGQIAREYPKVTPEDHAAQIRRDFEALAAA